MLNIGMPNWNKEKNTMSSEKSRYLNRGPSPLFNMNQLKNHLSFFTKEHLIEIIWLNAQTTPELWRALNAYIGMKLAKGDWIIVKEAIDYALCFPDIVGYSERGHGIIIYEMIRALEYLYENGDKALALQAAKYILNEGQNALHYFEDDWSWSCALEDVSKWINNRKEPVT